MSDLSRMPDDGSTPHTVVRVTTRTAVWIVAGVAAVFLARGVFVSAQRILGWAAASVAVAIFVEPLVSWLGRYINRVAATLGTFVLMGAVIGGLVFGAVDDLDHEVDRLQAAAPAATMRLETRDDELGRAMRDLQLTQRVQGFLDELDDRVGSGSGALAQNAPTAPIYFVCTILVIFLLVYGPSMVDGAAGQVRDASRREVMLRVLNEAVQRTRRAVAAMLVQGVLVGGAVWAAAYLIDLPAPLVLGLFAGVAAMIPDFGILLGVLPTVALVAGIESVRGAVVFFGVALCIQIFEGAVVRPRIDRWAVAVGPAVIWTVVVLGYTLHGVGLAIYGTVYAVFVLAVIDRVPSAREELAR